MLRQAAWTLMKASRPSYAMLQCLATRKFATDIPDDEPKKPADPATEEVKKALVEKISQV